MSERRTRILVVDDDVIVARSIAAFLSSTVEHATEWTERGETALRMLETAAAIGPEKPADPYAVLIVDVELPDMSGLELVKRVQADHPEAVCIAITGYGTIESAVKAIRLGAIDYVTKPIVDDELLMLVEKAVRQHALVAENVNLRQQLDQRYGLDRIVGADTRMRRIYDIVEAVAPSRTTVLMSGESGTGKSLIARAVHRNSPRASGPFVEISCGSIPETLLESELFGHVKGAFTGAHADKPGRFLAADGGTLFLDEINSASPAMQLKLLRVLQEKRFEPVGSHEPTEVDVRVILASNESLEELVADGRFRQDLYYRINVVMIHVPPLRERLGDIPILAAHFLDQKARELSRQITGFTDEALDALRRYAFPGNVRELENVIERAVVLTRSTRVGVDDLPPGVLDNSTGHLLPGRGRGLLPWREDGGDWVPQALRDALEEPERRIILAALSANEWNRQKTADDLQINRTTLYKKIKYYRLDEEFAE